MTSHYTWGSVITLHDFGGVLERPLGPFFWALTISWSRLLARVWSGPNTISAGYHKTPTGSPFGGNAKDGSTYYLQVCKKNPKVRLSPWWQKVMESVILKCKVYFGLGTWQHNDVEEAWWIIFECQSPGPSLINKEFGRERNFGLGRWHNRLEHSVLLTLQGKVTVSPPRASIFKKLAGIEANVIK